MVNINERRGSWLHRVLRISHGWVPTPKEKKIFILPPLRLREHGRRRSGKELKTRRQEEGLKNVVSRARYSHYNHDFKAAMMVCTESAQEWVHEQSGMNEG